MRSRLLGAASLLAVLLLWEGASKAGWVNPHLLTPPSTVGPTLWRLLQSGELTPHIEATMERIFVGFALAVPLGIILGMVCALWKPAYELVIPVLETVRAIPPLALLPVFLIFFGIGFKFPAAIVLWVAWVPIFYNTVMGIRSVPHALTEAAYDLGAGPIRTIWAVTLPLAAPSIVTGMRLGLGGGFLVINAAETMGEPVGLGFYIYNASQTFHIPEMYAAIVVLGVLAALSNVLLMGVSRVFLRRVSEEEPAGVRRRPRAVTWPDGTRHARPRSVGKRVVASPKGPIQAALEGRRRG